MKRIVVIMCAVLFLLPALSSCAKVNVSTENPQSLSDYLKKYGTDEAALKKSPLYGSEITVYNWGEYMDEDLNSAFEDLTGIKVNYRYFQSNEALYSTLKSGGASYDIVIPSDYMIALLIEENMLKPIDTSLLSNYQYIVETAKNTTYDPKNSYSVPYMTGSVGLVYNTTMISSEPDSWDILFDPAYSGQILMFDNPRDAFAIALKKLGYSFNTTTVSELEEAFNLLQTQKPLVQAYVMDQIYEKLLSGEAAVGPYYAGDSVIMMEENEDLAFVHPKEGMNLFIDAFCIPTSSTNTAGAYLYIDYMCSTEAGLANVYATGYTTPLSNVYDALDEDTRSNTVMYPSEEVMSKGEIFTNLPADIRAKYDEMWSKLLSK